MLIKYSVDKLGKPDVGTGVCQFGDEWCHFGVQALVCKKNRINPKSIFWHKRGDQHNSSNRIGPCLAVSPSHAICQHRNMDTAGIRQAIFEPSTILLIAGEPLAHTSSTGRRKAFEAEICRGVDLRSCDLADRGAGQ